MNANDDRVSFEGMILKEYNFTANPNFKQYKFNKDDSGDKIVTVYTSFPDNHMKMDIEISIYRDAKAKNYPFSLNMTLSGLFEKLDDSLTIKEFEMIGAEILNNQINSLIYESTNLFCEEPLELTEIDIRKLMSDENLL